MKALICFLLMIGTAQAQDAVAYLKNFDAKIYSLKNKGVKDFVVDIESSKLTKEMNEQKIFGKVEDLIFRTYWTASPERLAIEVIGLPEGFKEIKEDLKMSVLGIMDNLLPPSTTLAFNGYKFSQGSKKREIVANDTTGIAAIPSFILRFDEQDKISEIVGNKPIGTLSIKPVYKKESFTDNKLVLIEQTTTNSEGGQVMTVHKTLDYDKINGIGVLEEVEVSTEQKLAAGKSISLSETVTFKNYKINEGHGLNYFLKEAKNP